MSLGDWSTREDDQGPWDDCCSHCGAHYLDHCEPGCDCDTCIKARDEDWHRRMVELDIAAGE